MPQATTKPVNVTYIPLDTPADMGNALNTALTINYRGKVEAFKDAENKALWRIELTGPGNVDDQGRQTAVVALLGWVLIWDGAKLMSMTQADFNTKYTSIP